MTVFLLLVAAVVVVVAAALLVAKLTWWQLALLVVVLVVVIRLAQVRWIVKFADYERGVVLRFGRFSRVAGPGWAFIMPFTETYTLIDTRVQTVDVKPQKVISKDQIGLTVDAVIFYQVKDPKTAVLKVGDYAKAFVLKTQAELRNVVGNMTAADVIANVGEINKRISEALAAAAAEWGVTITSVELQSVELPEEIVHAMREKKVAEQIKLAAEQRALGEKIQIDVISEAASKITEPAMRYLYLKSLGEIARGKSTKLIFPMELADLARSLSGAPAGTRPFERVFDELRSDYQKRVAELAPEAKSSSERTKKKLFK